MTENQSIKDTLNIIRKALEDDNSDSTTTNEDILILNKLVKEDGTIDILGDNILNKDEVKDIINKKASEVMTKKPKMVEVNTLVGEALNIMNVKKITSLFVCAHSKPVGIVHIHDLLRLSS